MKALLTILFRVFLLFAITGHLTASGLVITPRDLFINSENELPTMLPEDANLSGNTSPAEAPVEESEEEDETSKENAIHRLASLNFSCLLQQRYLHQQRIFRQPRLEIETPPPKGC